MLTNDIVSFEQLGPGLLWNSGSSCSKLTMSFFNILLKLWSLNTVYTLIFLLTTGSYLHFFSKNTCEFGIVLTRTVNILTMNEFIKLMMHWATGPWSFMEFWKIESDLTSSFIKWERYMNCFTLRLPSMCLKRYHMCILYFIRRSIISVSF